MAQNKNEENKSENVSHQDKQETVGTLLRKTRLAKKQDLQDIASYLCIRYQFLEALEESRYKELPGEAYAHGFIRSYAAYLGLDPAEIIARYKQEFFAHLQEEKRILGISEEEPENMIPAPKVLLLSLVLLVAAYGIWQISSKDEEIIPVEPLSSMESITVVDQSYPLVEETTISDSAVAENKTESQSVVVPPVPPVKPEYQGQENVSLSTAQQSIQNLSSQENVPVQENVASEPQTIRVYGQKNYNPRLVLVATEETWIEITRNDDVIFSRLLNAGDRYQVSSNKPEELFLKTGNAGGLEIYCDGQLTQSLGPHGALRSNIALIPEDFAAKVVEDIE